MQNEWQVTIGSNRGTAMNCARCGHAREDHEESNLHAPCNVRDVKSHCICYAFVSEREVIDRALKSISELVDGLEFEGHDGGGDDCSQCDAVARAKALLPLLTSMQGRAI